MEKAMKFLAEMDSTKSYHFMVKDIFPDGTAKIRVNEIGNHTLDMAREVVKDWEFINKSTCLAGINAYVRWTSYIEGRATYQICIDVDCCGSHYTQFILLYARA